MHSSTSSYAPGNFLLLIRHFHVTIHCSPLYLAHPSYEVEMFVWKMFVWNVVCVFLVLFWTSCEGVWLLGDELVGSPVDDPCCGTSGFGGVSGTTPLPLPKTCFDIREFGGGQDAVYTIFVSDINKCGRKDVFCEQQQEGGGWTVVQRRWGGRENFNRPWTDYVRGFGNLQGEFFLGLDWIYRISMQRRHEMRIELRDSQWTEIFTKYWTFTLSDEIGNYTMKISDMDPNSNGGDGLSEHNNMPFSTYDRDNDGMLATNCARQNGGGWWYHGNDCFTSNLNMRYRFVGIGPKRRTAGVVWNRDGRQAFFPYVEMKIRPMI
ncbi:ficolin-1-like [Lytechinus pictus]|uniref:ficolin-1-like n=1 Tax=Lytechinus pictus TaxID=7653 RepID=UPI0030B9EA99